MCQKRINGEEKVRILAWRQEDLTTKTICRRTKRARSYVMVLLAAACDLTRHAIPLPNLDLDDHRRPPNILLIY